MRKLLFFGWLVLLSLPGRGQEPGIDISYIGKTLDQLKDRIITPKGICEKDTSDCIYYILKTKDSLKVAGIYFPGANLSLGSRKVIRGIMYVNYYKGKKKRDFKRQAYKDYELLAVFMEKNWKGIIMSSYKRKSGPRTGEFRSWKKDDLTIYLDYSYSRTNKWSRSVSISIFNWSY